jgi:predicted GNAT family acetyltransferase
VCTGPDYRGRGYARALVARLGRAILDRGEIRFLHVHSANHVAISVYRRLGFRFAVRHASDRASIGRAAPAAPAGQRNLISD